MNLKNLLSRRPQVADWIDATLAEHAGNARSVSDFGFERLPTFFSKNLLRHTKVVTVARVPVPPLSALGMPELADFERGDYAGMTFKDTYFVKESEAQRESLHCHELVHVVQWAHLGVAGFLAAYAAGLAGHGYRNSPLEVMAYDLQADFDHNKPLANVESLIRSKLDELSH